MRVAWTRNATGVMMRQMTQLYKMDNKSTHLIRSKRLYEIAPLKAQRTVLAHRKQRMFITITTAIMATTPIWSYLVWF